MIITSQMTKDYYEQGGWLLIESLKKNFKGRISIGLIDFDTELSGMDMKRIVG